MTPALLRPGVAEPLKAVVHGAACGLCVVMAAYNLGAWCCRRERHLAVNAVLYGAGVAYEWQQMRHHATKDGR